MRVMQLVLKLDKMGKYKDKHGESRIKHFFRDSKLVNGIKKFAPNLVDGIGDVIAAKTGIKWFDEIGDKIAKSDKIPPKDKELLLADIEDERLRFMAILADIQDARNMQVEALRQDDKFAKRFIYYFASIFSLITIAVVIALLFVKVPEENKTLVDMSLGVLIGTGITGIFNFFFGSSQKEKEN